MLSPIIRSTLSALLASKGQRLTTTREQIYDVLLLHKEALSMVDIELLLDTVDKSTISRTIHILLEVGAIHKIEDGSGVFKYATSPIVKGSRTPHAHFYCTTCERTYCLDDPELAISLDLPEVLDEIKLPKGFECHSVSILLKGTCPSCS